MEYAKTHKLSEHLNTIINAVCISKPFNPFPFMANLLRQCIQNPIIHHFDTFIQANYGGFVIGVNIFIGDDIYTDCIDSLYLYSFSDDLISECVEVKKLLNETLSGVSLADYSQVSEKLSNMPLSGLNLFDLSVLLAKAVSVLNNTPLWKQLDIKTPSLPSIVIPLLFGGEFRAHGSHLPFTSIGLIFSSISVFEMIQQARSIFGCLSKLISQKFGSPFIFKGGFAPPFSKLSEEPFSLLSEAVSAAKLEFSDNLKIFIVSGASRMYDSDKKRYEWFVKTLSADSLITEYNKFVNKFQIYAIQSPLVEEFDTATIQCKVYDNPPKESILITQYQHLLTDKNFLICDPKIPIDVCLNKSLAFMLQLDDYSNINELLRIEREVR